MVAYSFIKMTPFFSLCYFTVILIETGLFPKIIVKNVFLTLSVLCWIRFNIGSKDDINLLFFTLDIWMVIVPRYVGREKKCISYRSSLMSYIQDWKGNSRLLTRLDGKNAKYPWNMVKSCIENVNVLPIFRNF